MSAETIRLIMSGDRCIVCNIECDGHLCLACRLDYLDEHGEHPEQTSERIPGRGPYPSTHADGTPHIDALEVVADANHTLQNHRQHADRPTGSSGTP